VKCRLGYLAKPKDEFITHLREIGSDLDEYFLQNHVVITDNLEYEEYFEGWKRSILEKAKAHFIVDTIFDLDYSKEEMVELFGPFENEIQLFDNCWYFEDADIAQIPTDWKKT